jgi:hypothetical protein
MIPQRGFLWTLYGNNPANPRKPNGKTAAYSNLHFLIHAAWRSWRAWHPGEVGAVCDHDGSLSLADLEVLNECRIGLFVPPETYDPPSTLNKLVTLSQSPWPLTMHVDLDIVWTANAAPIWDLPGDWDLAGLDLPYGHAYPNGTQKGESWGADGTPRIPCACVLLCRVVDRIADVFSCVQIGDWSDEVLLARAEENGLLRLGRIPNHYIWDTWEGSGWQLCYDPQLRSWMTRDPAGQPHAPICLHWGGHHGKPKALASESLRHYLGGLWLPPIG